MHAITICEPYATLIRMGPKRVENRTWETKYRGPLIIHAGKSKAWLDSYEPVPNMVFGAVVAICELAACVHKDSLDKFAARDREKWGWLPNHEHALGPWCWVLTDVHRFLTPVPWPGRQGLWNIDSSVLKDQELVMVA